MKEFELDKKPSPTKTMLDEMLQEFVMVLAMGVWGSLRSLVKRHKFFAWTTLAVSLFTAHLICVNAWHLDLLYLSGRPLVTPEFVLSLVAYHYFYHLVTVWTLLMIPMWLFIGWCMRSTRTKFQQLFIRAKLVNGAGDTPKLIDSYGSRRSKMYYVFDPNGVGLQDFQAREDSLKTYFKRPISSIDYGKHCGQIVVVVNHKDFPAKVSYDSVSTQTPLPIESFYIGQSADGVKTQDITELPHMLIAGSTGGGKSVFFKQALIGLLESSPYLQMYLIDLKGGLEMIDFKQAPNVKVIKELDSAVHILKRIELEMRSRFDYLEKSGYKAIDPKRDKLDRIVVAIDESSVLYAMRTRTDPDYNLTMEARRLADSISKLSRAAGIHLLLATQKLDKQVIPTSVSENISGRMAFRANALASSMQMLNNGDATKLPEIPGRGIWSFGTTQVEVQAPMITPEQIQQVAKDLAQSFYSGHRHLQQPMLTIASESNDAEQQAGSYDGFSDGEEYGKT